MNIGRMPKILVVHPGASWSTSDVFDGLVHGLRHWGADVLEYRLDGRIEHEHKAIAALYRRAKICLNFYRKSRGFGAGAPRIDHAESLNPRAYELAACGAFHLSDQRAEVTEKFGDLVPTFTTAGEAEALIRRWLADEAGRAAVAAQLPARVAEDSWVHRARQVLGDLRQLLQPEAAA